MWWGPFRILAFGRWRQKDQDLKASFRNIKQSKTKPKTNKQTNKKKQEHRVCPKYCMGILYIFKSCVFFEIQSLQRLIKEETMNLGGRGRRAPVTLRSACST